LLFVFVLTQKEAKKSKKFNAVALLPALTSQNFPPTRLLVEKVPIAKFPFTGLIVIKDLINYKNDIFD